MIEQLFTVFNPITTEIVFNDPQNTIFDISKSISKKIQHTLKENNINFSNFTYSKNGIFSFISKKKIKSILVNILPRSVYSISEENFSNGIENFFIIKIKIKEIEKTMEINLLSRARKLFKRSPSILQIVDQDFKILVEERFSKETKQIIRSNNFLTLTIFNNNNSLKFDNFFDKFINNVKIIKNQDVHSVCLYFSENFIEKLNLEFRKASLLSGIFSINKTNYKTVVFSKNSLSFETPVVVFESKSLEEAQEIAKRITNPQEKFQIINDRQIENKRFKKVRAIFFIFLLLCFLLYIIFQKRRWIIIARFLSILLSYFLIGNFPPEYLNFEFFLSVISILFFSSLLSFDDNNARYIVNTSIFCFLNLLVSKIVLYFGYFALSYIFMNVFYSLLIFLGVSFITSSMSKKIT